MLKTNVDSLVIQKVRGEVIHPQLWVERGYATTWDGRPKLTVGIGGIVSNVKVGDPVFGWYADHLNAGVAVSNPDASRATALNGFSCIGNKVRVLTGEAKGSEGVIVGKTTCGRTRLVVYFSDEDFVKLAIGDKVEVEAWGVGLTIEGFEDVRVLSLSPRLLEAMGVEVRNDRLQVPVVMELPGKIMGTGVGGRRSWDIQSCSPELNEDLGLKKLRFGDLVAVKDVNSDFGNTVYEGGIIVGVVSHGASEIGGHGPGLAVIFSSKKRRIEPVVDGKANVAYYLGLRKDLAW